MRGRLFCVAALVLWAGGAHALSGAANESTVADGKVRVRCSDNTLMTCLAGRTGSTNNPTISSDSNGTISGSGATAMALTLQANTADGASQGSVGITPGAAGGVSLTTPSSGFIDFFRTSGPVATRYNDGSGNYVALQSPASLGVNKTYTLPAAAPTVSGQALVSTTGGTMSWAGAPAFVAAAFITANFGGL